MRARTILLVICVTLIGACSAPQRKPAVPLEDTRQAQVPGIPNARFLVARDPGSLLDEALRSLEKERAYVGLGKDDDLSEVNYLAVSGGGDFGAFGAGLLVGWSELGTRPEFKVVTGVSTGALIAPFAFLGEEYDARLKDVYTTTGPDDVQERRSLLAAITSDGMADNAPLYALIAKYIDREMLDKIAAEYAKGRVLLIGTANLDARTPVIWNMGAIAASDAPGAEALFHRILLASAAIPGIFPPVMIDVEVDGQVHQEMHVDGGTVNQVFLFPPNVISVMKERGVDIERKRRVYIIRNARLDPDWAMVDRQTMDIAGRAISSLIHTQGIGDLYRIYLISQSEEVDYNLAYVGADFNAEHREQFDTAFMRALFDYGYRAGRVGYDWKKQPPDASGLQ